MTEMFVGVVRASKYELGVARQVPSTDVTTMWVVSRP